MDSRLLRFNKMSLKGKRSYKMQQDIIVSEQDKFKQAFENWVDLASKSIACEVALLRLKSLSK